VETSDHYGDIIVRPEIVDDVAAIHGVNEEAFGGAVEADLVDVLRKKGAVDLSLVAVNRNIIVGHILFSPAEIVSGRSSYPATALAPMAVLPAMQGKGIGSMLVRQGLRKLEELGHGLVIVLGHPAYYPRFGFVPASRFRISCPYEAPDEAFMALELRAGASPREGGKARFQSEFDAV